MLDSCFTHNTFAGNQTQGNNMIQVFYKTKKELKEQVGKSLFYKETSFFGEEYKSNGTFNVADGSPQRKWFATVTMKDNVIAKVS